MNINFIIPSWHYFDDPFKLQPYWELYYATILRKKLNNDANIVFTDLRGKSKTNVDFSETLNNIQESDYYLYWIMKSGDANEVYSIVKYLKDKYPNSKHIAGGTHVDMVKEECQKVFDSIIIGPGENSFFKAIQEGKSIDFLEIDAASRTGVEHMRELLSSVHTSPSVSRFKIFLIDEVHMLSKGSFNALLKTLEEPPSHVIFLMATTDPEKVPKTVISRCLQLNLKTVSRNNLQEHFRKICEKEGINSDDESLSLVAKSAEGSVRDGLTLLDQAIAHGNGKLVADDVKKLLGTIDDSLIYELLDSITDGRKEDAFKTLNNIEKLNPDYEALLKDLISNIHEVSLHQVLENSNKEPVAKIASKMDEQYCQLIYEIGLNSFQKIHTHPSPREAVEMCLLRMLAFQPVQNMNTGEAKTQKKKANKAQIKTINKEKPQINEKVAQESHGIDSSSWPALFNDMQLSSFAKNYFGNLSIARFNDQK